METIPEVLLEISSPPRALFYKGLPLEKNFRGVAIVGTRKATPLGLSFARSVAEGLTSAGIPIISGLALGIDSAAHAGALEAGGRTIAVLGNGTDTVYPPENKSLFEKIIASGGSIISEYEERTPPAKHRFLERNRLIAGLSVAVIVIEAPARSGAINTASHAADYGREVFVLPGPANHPNYVGSHRLIRDGARLVSSLEDIMEDLKLQPLPFKTKPRRLPAGTEEIFKSILNSPAPLPIDKIISITKLEPRIVALGLTRLIIEELVSESAGNYSAAADPKNNG